MKATLNDKYINAGKENRYFVQTHSQSKDTKLKLPEVHGAEKGINPDLKQEWIVRKSQKLAVTPRLEQDRVDPSVQGETLGYRRKTCSRTVNARTKKEY